MRRQSAGRLAVTSSLRENAGSQRLEVDSAAHVALGTGRATEQVTDRPVILDPRREPRRAAMGLLAPRRRRLSLGLTLFRHDPTSKPHSIPYPGVRRECRLRRSPPAVPLRGAGRRSGWRLAAARPAAGRAPPGP